MWLIDMLIDTQSFHYRTMNRLEKHSYAHSFIRNHGVLPHSISKGVYSEIKTSLQHGDVVFHLFGRGIGGILRKQFLTKQPYCRPHSGIIPDTLLSFTVPRRHFKRDKEACRFWKAENHA